MTARRHISPAIEIAAAADGAPEWVQLTPADTGLGLPSTDGRRHRLSDPAAVVARFRESFTTKGLKRPIDIGHDGFDGKGAGALAFGWIRDLEVRDGEIWGQVDWTAQGAEWVSGGYYKYLSAEYLVAKETGEILEILAAGLVNRPGFVVREIAEEDTSEESDIMDKDVLSALGLGSGATAAEAVAKIKDLQREVHTAKAAEPDPQVWVAKAQLDAASARIAELEAAETARAAAELEAAVDAGVKAGKIAPAARDGFVAMARAQGLEAFEKTLEAMPQIVGGKSGLDDLALLKTAGALSPEEIAVARQLGHDELGFAAAKKEYGK